MIAEIGAGLGSAKALLDIAKGLHAAATQAEINDVKIALQNEILSIQNALSAANVSQTGAADRIRELEQEIVQLKDWEREKQRYELRAVDSGAFAYAPKLGMEGGEPPHWLCTTCFEGGHRSFMQFQKTGQIGGEFRDSWQCNKCTASMVLAYGIRPQTGSQGEV